MQRPESSAAQRRGNRTYLLSYIKWEDDRGRGYDACHSFSASTDSEAKTLADEHLRGVKTSGPVALRVVERRTLAFRRSRG